MDEPFSAVDEQTRRKFQEDLLEVVAKMKQKPLFSLPTQSKRRYMSPRVLPCCCHGQAVSLKLSGPIFDRDISPDAIRRDPVYLDIVERIWQGLRTYVE